MVDDNPEIHGHKTEYYEHISPTAFVIAYERTFSDIEFSQEIFSAIQEKVLMGEAATEESKLTGLAPRYEARYKLINKLLDEINNEHVVEIAPGMSPRGLTYSAKSPSLTYVELDLPHISKMKGRVLEQVKRSHGIEAPGLIQVAGNALDRKSTEHAASLFGSAEPIAFINEGLMRYFDFDEKKLLATNILSILRQTGGAWITPDITLRSFNTGIMRTLEHRVADMSGIAVSNNYFESLGQAVDFFEQIGFDIQVRSFMEVKNQLSSTSALNLGKDEVEAYLKPAFAFVMKPK